MSSSYRKAHTVDRENPNTVASLLKRASQIQNSPAVQKNKGAVPRPTINHKDLFIHDPEKRTAAETVLDILTQDTKRGFQSREQ